MNQASQFFSDLARRAGAGDIAAQAELESDVMSIVRQILRGGGADSYLERRILHEVKRQKPQQGADELAHGVAHKLCSNLAAAMSARAPDSVRPEETVVSYSSP